MKMKKKEIRKKMISIFLILAVLISVPIVFSQEETIFTSEQNLELEQEPGQEFEQEPEEEFEQEPEEEFEQEPEEEFEQELEKMVTPYGAEHRLYVLQKSLETKIEEAKEIYSLLVQENISEDILDLLEQKIIDLELFLEEIQNFDLEKEVSEITAEFVSLKKEIITTSQEFKRILYENIDNTILIQMREEIKENKRIRIQEKKQEIEEHKEKILLRQLNRTLTQRNQTIFNEELLNQTRLGIEQKQQIMRQIREMDQETKNQIREQLRTEEQQHLINKEQLKNQAKELIDEKRNQLKEKINNVNEEKINEVEEELLQIRNNNRVNARNENN